MRRLHHVGLALALCSAAATAQEIPTPATASRSGPRWETSPELRNRFVRDQTILGLTVYAPSFAAMVGRDGVTGSAGYLVMAGGSFFAAAELTRHIQMTEARHVLSTSMAMRFAGSALLIASQGDMETRSAAAVTLLGGLGGTATGLYFGGGLTGGEAATTVFGHDLAWLTAFAITVAGDDNPWDSSGVDRLSSSVAWTAAGVGGYLGGRWYAGHARHNITVGDVQTLWIGATIGAMAGGATIASSDPNPEVVAVTLLSGGWLGVILTERTIVRRYDHTRSEGNLIALGGGAGALMGMGIGILVSGEAERGGSATIGFATLGAVGGVAMAERYLQPKRDEGRIAWLDRVRITPGALVAVAAKSPGKYPLVSFTF